MQIRGSIPLFWSQKPNLKYKPKPQLGQLNHAEAYSKHFEELILRYGRVVSVNLVQPFSSEESLKIGAVAFLIVIGFYIGYSLGQSDWFRRGVRSSIPDSS
jgi:hypothetical protein